MALAPPQKELATRRPTPAAALRRTAAVPDEQALTLPASRKLAGGDAVA